MLLTLLLIIFMLLGILHEREQRETIENELYELSSENSVLYFENEQMREVIKQLREME